MNSKRKIQQIKLERNKKALKSQKKDLKQNNDAIVCEIVISAAENSRRKQPFPIVN